MSARPPLRLTALALTAGLALTVTACSPNGADEPRAAAAASSSVEEGVARVALSTAIEHAHGLVVTDDGTLLAGTHTGTITVGRDGRTARVGTVDDDLMGMTGIPGTDRLLSSGHTGANSSLPNPVGLRSSDDGGRSWTALSLAGQVDFHALATDGGLVVGFDGARGMRVSRDGGRTWTDGAAIASAALAMTPGSVWATTEQGVQRSTDSGQTFSLVPDAPVLRLLSSGADDSLWGVDLEGYAWRSKDGATWEKRAAVGQVDALAVADFASAYAITAKQLHILT